jgi:hypothetical protein
MPRANLKRRWKKEDGRGKQLHSLGKKREDSRQKGEEMPDGRGKREALSYTELRGKIEEGRWKQLRHI